LLEIEKISTHYGKISAIDSVSLKVEEGQIVTILGANGAGKTTVLKTLSGLLKCTSGRIAFRGEDITALNAQDIISRGIVHVPEGRKIFPFMTVAENLDMGAYLRTDADGVKSDMENAYAYFPILRERKNQKAGTLSGGEQQMLAIGRGLMARPRLFLLDEPSLGLAPKLVEDIFRIITEIHRQGITILLVEQNASMALEVSDVAYVLEVGKVVQFGKAADMIHDEGIRKAYLGIR
jgi:branched-chain amino acid transport system ATP-binding protein